MRLLRRVFEPHPVERWDGEEQTDDHRRERKRLSENHYLRAQALAAWLLATLVGVNGGAIAIDFTGQEHAAPFAVGVVLALVSGFASWQESQDRTGLHYVESLRAENVTDFGKRKQQTWRWRSRVMNLVAKVANIGSLAAFIMGCVWIAWH